MKKTSPPLSVLFLTFLGFFGGAGAFALDDVTTLVSYTPNIVVEPKGDKSVDWLIEKVEDEAKDDVLYYPPSDAQLEAMAGELELLVFTADRKGKCPACDEVAPYVDGLTAIYPITKVYCSMSTRPKTRGDYTAVAYRVKAFPTFVLVERLRDGDAVEITRWTGAGGFFNSTERKIREAFRRAGFIPPKVAPVKPPKPRPIPGLKPRPDGKKGKGREVPFIPGREPGRPRFSFSIEEV